MRKRIVIVWDAQCMAASPSA